MMKSKLSISLFLSLSTLTLAAPLSPPLTPPNSPTTKLLPYHVVSPAATPLHLVHSAPTPLAQEELTRRLKATNFETSKLEKRSGGCLDSTDDDTVNSIFYYGG